MNNKLAIKVIQLSVNTYFWVLANNENIILASSRLIGDKFDVMEEATNIAESLFLESTDVIIEERS